MKLTETSLTGFIEALSAGGPTPGGGSVAALCASFSAALCTMVARLTVDKKKYRDQREIMEALISDTQPMTDRFLALAQADMDAYDGVMAAMRLPRESEAQQEARRTAIEAATRGATRAPLETLRLTARLARLVELTVTRGNSNCITDAGTAVHLLGTAARSAAWNVRINLTGLSDETFVTACRRETDQLVSDMELCVTRLQNYVNGVLDSPS
jgi:formiminotetrahydrofolate cyclodeaminase